MYRQMALKDFNDFNLNLYVQKIGKTSMQIHRNERNNNKRSISISVAVKPVVLMLCEIED